MCERNIPHFEWREPDWDGNPLTAIATAPLRGSEREFFRKYRLYGTPVAQITERLTLNREDVGENPTGGAMPACTEASVRV